MKKTLIALGLIIVIVALVGIYRFNFTDDDIYIELSPGEVVGAGQVQLDTENNILMTISKKEFEAKYLAMKEGGAQLIDVRTQAEWDAGHYEQADILIDFYAPDFAEQLDALDKNLPYFIHCRSGSRSGQALRIMRSLGFAQVYDLRGGFSNAQDILTVVK